MNAWRCQVAQMKSSEILRGAADRLWTGQHYPPTRPVHLCWCVVKEAGITSEWISLYEAIARSPRKHQAICKILEKETMFWGDGVSTAKERQSQRFMYAHFLAEFFESIGD